MNMFKKLSFLFAALMMAALVGCAGTSTQESTGEYVDDTWITGKVKASLAKEESLKAREINVETFKGEVQLSGFVADPADIKRAETLTRSIKGVKNVKNDIQTK